MKAGRLGYNASWVDNGQKCVDVFGEAAKNAANGTDTEPPYDLVLMYVMPCICSIDLLVESMLSTMKHEAANRCVWFVCSIAGCRDGQMPELDGYKATAALRALGLTVPIVGVTGNALLEDQESFINAGANEVVCKPVTRDRLMQTLARYCPGDR